MIVDPRLNEQPEPNVRHPEYAENGAARVGRRLAIPIVTWSLLLIAIVASAVAGALPLTVVFVIVLAMLGLIQVTSLMTSLPLGIRIDQQGIRIGGVEAAEAGRSRVRPRDKPIQGFTRSMHVYSCDWEGVRRIKVLTDPVQLKAMSTSFNRGVAEYRGAWWDALGTAPWAPGRFVDVLTGGALVIEVETQRATFQATRPPKGKLGGTLAQEVYMSQTMKWVIPTKNAEGIRAALAAAQPPVTED